MSCMKVSIFMLFFIWVVDYLLWSIMILVSVFVWYKFWSFFYIVLWFFRLEMKFCGFFVNINLRMFKVFVFFLCRIFYFWCVVRVWIFLMVVYLFFLFVLDFFKLLVVDVLLFKVFLFLLLMVLMKCYKFFFLKICFIVVFYSF